MNKLLLECAKPFHDNSRDNFSRLLLSCLLLPLAEHCAILDKEVTFTRGDTRLEHLFDSRYPELFDTDLFDLFTPEEKQSVLPIYDATLDMGDPQVKLLLRIQYAKLLNALDQGNYNLTPVQKNVLKRLFVKQISLLNGECQVPPPKFYTPLIGISQGLAKCRDHQILIMLLTRRQAQLDKQGNQANDKLKQGNTQRLKLRLEYLTIALLPRLNRISYSDILQVELECARIIRATSCQDLTKFW